MNIKEETLRNVLEAVIQENKDIGDPESDAIQNVAERLALAIFRNMEIRKNKELDINCGNVYDRSLESHLSFIFTERYRRIYHEYAYPHHWYHDYDIYFLNIKHREVPLPDPKEIDFNDNDDVKMFIELTKNVQFFNEFFADESLNKAVVILPKEISREDCPYCNRDHEYLNERKIDNGLSIEEMYPELDFHL